jgi:hypothetical protein
VRGFFFLEFLNLNDTNGRPVPEIGNDTLAYNADGTLATITRTVGADTWVETYTYTNGVLTNMSGWVKQ